jgi:hypothetical protein
MEQDSKLFKQLTDVIELSLSSEANNSSGGKEIPHGSQNSVIHSNPPLVPVLSQTSPVFTFIPVLLKILFNIILSVIAV